jgi:hypothetical protein
MYVSLPHDESLNMFVHKLGMVRGASYYSHQVERTLDKLSSRGPSGNPLKYTNCRVYISLENKLSSTGQTLGAKTSIKCCHVGVLETTDF